MLARHRTQVVFWTALALSAISLAAAVLVDPWLFLLVGASLGYNLWAVVKSDREGFIRSKQLRRAHEPARHFSEMQTFLVLALIMAQVGAAVYFFLVVSGQ